MQLTGVKRLFLLLAPLVLLTIPLSLLVLLLNRIASSLTTSNLYRDRSDGLPAFRRPDTNASVPILTNIIPSSAIIGAPLVTLGIAALSCGGIFELRRRLGNSRRYERTWASSMVLINLLGAGLCLGVLVWTSVVVGREHGWARREDLKERKDTDGFPSVAPRDADRFTRETWTCSLHGLFGDAVGWAGSVCGLMRAARFLLIPLAISLLLTLLSIYALARDRGGLEWLFAGKERYDAFENTYQMNANNDPRAGPTPYPPPPMYYPYPAPPYVQPGAHAQQPGPQSGQPQNGSGAQSEQGVPTVMQPKYQTIVGQQTVSR